MRRGVDRSPSSSPNHSPFTCWAMDYVRAKSSFALWKTGRRYAPPNDVERPLHALLLRRVGVVRNQLVERLLTSRATAWNPGDLRDELNRLGDAGRVCDLGDRVPEPAGWRSRTT